jgi:hypothetical protein
MANQALFDALEGRSPFEPTPAAPGSSTILRTDDGLVLTLTVGP